MSAARLILGKRVETANQECICKVARMNQALKEQATKDTPWPDWGGKKETTKIQAVTVLQLTTGRLLGTCRYVVRIR